MERAQNKASRLIQIENLLLAYPEGLTQAELARRLQVDRSTINRYLVDLPKHIYIEEDGRLKLDRTADLINVRLNLHEALAVHLASRLLATRMDRQNPHAAAALRKLGIAMERWAPRISRHVLQSADMMDEAGQRQDPGYLEVLEKLTLAWAEQRKIQVWHRSETAGRVMEYNLSPYFIEPYAVGQTTHVIGHSEPPGKLRTLKIERIERAVITRENYEIPVSFDPRDLLSEAWGIWYTESAPQDVTLKFHPRVARRVQETRWHRSEEETELPDGSILWRAKVAEPQEMLPWIRGWGADVEVLEPEGLRKSIEKEARKMARLYQLEGSENIPRYFHLWAKTDQEHGSDKLHRLIYHMLDVGECVLALWQNALSEQTRQAFAGWLGLDIEASGRQLAFWAALHDLGKAAPGFQRKYKLAIAVLEKEGFEFPATTAVTPAPHGVLSAWALKELLPQETGLAANDARQIAFALGGHHGAWPTSDRIQSPALQSADKGNGQWDTARKELLLAVKEVYQPANTVSLPKASEKQDELNTFLTLFSGLVSIADWIGSMVEYFPLEDDHLPLRKYSGQAKQQAKAALEKLGWLGWQAEGSFLSFAAMFPEIRTPNAIQQATFDATTGLELPALVILEAPTGIGKTEAALYLADTWLQSRQGKGIYIAMPTQATSNQMFERVVDFLQKRYPGQSINTHLVHGAALLAEDEQTPEPQGIAQDDKTAEGDVNAETWFLPRKRTLLAPFGVGTVDQALMSVLQTNHFFVRMFGLGQKVVVFDEVHAYDTYMSTLFQRLLRWLRSIGTSVILLSATLSDKTRLELAGAWLGNAEVILPEAAYPRLTVVSAGKVEVVPLPAPKSRTLQLTWIAPTPEQVADHLAEKLKDGGCAVVICNRVQRAQEVYAALKGRSIVEAENLILFHARFPFQWRKDIEDRVLNLFSKKSQRPHKAIVVATQVIEQSLDLDFDYMVTDLAPVDLLLQRAGRLHRHTKNDTTRPAGFQTSVMAISLPDMQDDLPNFGLDARIYDEATLLRTWHILHNRQQLTLPEQTCGLIEAVYGGKVNEAEFTPAFLQALRDADKKKRLQLADEMEEALSRLIRLPEDEYLLTRTTKQLEEDDAQVGAAFRALTRLAEPSVALICLHETAQGIALEPSGEGAPVDVSKRPNLHQARELLRRAVSIQRRDVLNYFVNPAQRPSAEWRKSAAVRYHYPVTFDQNGEYHPDGAGFILKLSPELGLQIIKTEDK